MKFENEKQQQGHDFAYGAIVCIGRLCVFWIIIVLTVSLLRSVFAIGLDDSDSNGWNRSGLKIHLDAKTGIEYLSDGKGGLIERQSR